MTKRPREERVRTRLKTRCKWSTYETDGIIKNISIGGCFILTQNDLTMDDTVRVRIAVPKLLYMELAGRVVRKQSGLGFAVRFKQLSATERALLERAVKYLRDNQE